MLQLQGARKRTLLITVISHTTDVARQLEEHSREELMQKKMLLNFFLLSLGSIAKSGLICRIQGCNQSSCNHDYSIVIMISGSVFYCITVAINELLCMKNAGAQIAMNFSSHEGLGHMVIEKSKSWGPFWSYQLNSTANSAHLAQFLR